MKPRLTCCDTENWTVLQKPSLVRIVAMVIVLTVADRNQHGVNDDAFLYRSTEALLLYSHCC